MDKEDSDTIQWLNKEHIEDRIGLDDEVPAISEMMGTGQSVGGLVTSVEGEVGYEITGKNENLTFSVNLAGYKTEIFPFI